VQRLAAPARGGGAHVEPPLSADVVVEQVLARLGRELAVSAERRGLRPGDLDGRGFGR
jgi:hypothetical protein